jgi:hypothetical protein
VVHFQSPTSQCEGLILLNCLRQLLTK